MCGSTAESRTRADSPYPPSNTACILARTAPAPQDPRSVTLVAARRTAPVPAYSPPRDPLAIAGCPADRVLRRPADAADAHTLAALAWCAAVPNARCPVPGAQCPVLPGVRCSMPSAVCPVPCAQCPMCPNALCPIDCSPVRCSSAVRAAHVRAPVTPTSARRPICATAERALQPLDCHCLPRV